MREILDASIFILFSIAGAVAVIFEIIRNLIRVRPTRVLGIHLIKYMKIIDYAYLTFNKNKDQCLKRLDEIHKEVADLFNKGALDKWKYNLLNKKISVFLSLLAMKDPNSTDRENNASIGAKDKA